MFVAYSVRSRLSFLLLMKTVKQKVGGNSMVSEEKRPNHFNPV